MASYTSGVVAEIGSLIEYRPGVTEVESKTSWETMFCPVFWQEEYMNRIVKKLLIGFQQYQKKILSVGPDPQAQHEARRWFACWIVERTYGDVVVQRFYGRSIVIPLLPI